MNPQTIAAPIASAFFSAPLPRGLREEAGSMPVDDMLNAYAPTSGPVRLGQWECDARRSERHTNTYRATIAVGDHIGTMTADACGPVAALTSMLYERGIGLEVLDFHQVDSVDGLATFVRGSDGAHQEWAVGVSDDATQSALRAVIACANRLAA
jgi:hypothetical protein